jgi:cysteine synthase
MRVTDTLKSTKAFQAGGFTPVQSEVLADQQESTAQDLVANIGKMLSPKFDELRSELLAEIHAVARDQLFKLMTFGVALAGLCLGFGAFILAFLRTAS